MSRLDWMELRERRLANAREAMRKRRAEGMKSADEQIQRSRQKRAAKGNATPPDLDAAQGKLFEDEAKDSTL